MVTGVEITRAQGQAVTNNTSPRWIQSVQFPAPNSTLAPGKAQATASGGATATTIARTNTTGV
jgi:hypothetical protein